MAARVVAVLGPSGYACEGKSVVSAEKVRGETAVLLLATARACALDSELGQSHYRVADALLPFARSPELAARLAVDPTNALERALPHIALTRLGRPDRRFDRVLDAAARADGAQAHERLPHRRMEQAWLRRSVLPKNRAIVEPGLSTIVDAPFDALNSTVEDVSAFTHALMYATDFGTDEPVLARRIEVVAADAEAGLAQRLIDEDYDTAGEVLLAWPYLRRPWTAASVFGFICLARAEDEAGFLPSPSISLEVLRALSADERQPYSLAATYHTIYVMGLLVGAILGGDWLPPAVPSERPTWPGATDALLTIEPLTPSHATRTLLHLTAPSRDALAPMVLTMQLRSAVAGRRFGAVQRLLGASEDMRLPSTPASRQALELLERLAMLNHLRLLETSS